MKDRKLSSIPIVGFDPIFNRKLKDLEVKLFQSKNEFFIYKNLAEIFTVVDVEICKWAIKAEFELKGQPLADNLTIGDATHHLMELTALNAKIEKLLESVQDQAYRIQNAMINSFELSEPIIFKELL